MLGVLDQPILKERWVGVSGQPSTFNGNPVAVRPCAAVGDAYMYSTTPLMVRARCKSKKRNDHEETKPTIC